MRTRATGAGWLPIGRVCSLAWASWATVPAQLADLALAGRSAVDEFLHAQGGRGGRACRGAEGPRRLLVDADPLGARLDRARRARRAASRRWRGQVAPLRPRAGACTGSRPTVASAALRERATVPRGCRCRGHFATRSAARRARGGEPFRSRSAAWAIRAEPREAPPKLPGSCFAGRDPVMPDATALAARDRDRGRPLPGPVARLREPVARLCVVSDPGGYRRRSCPSRPRGYRRSPVATRPRGERICLEPRGCAASSSARVARRGGSVLHVVAASKSHPGSTGGRGERRRQQRRRAPFEPLLDSPPWPPGAPRLALAALVLGLGADHPVSAAAAADVAAASRPGRSRDGRGACVVSAPDAASRDGTVKGRPARAAPGRGGGPSSAAARGGVLRGARGRR